MKRLSMALIALTCITMIGCSGGADSTDEASDAAHEATSNMADTATDMAAKVIPVGTEVSLTGKTGCGHCTYKIGTSCSTALETADGKIFIIDGVDHESDVFKNRMEGGEITVAGVVKASEDGQIHVEMEEITM